MALTIKGEDGAMRISFPYHPQMGTRVNGTRDRPIEQTDKRSTHSHQLEAFRDAVRDGAPVATGAHPAVQHMRTLDDVYRAAAMEPGADLPDRVIMAGSRTNRCPLPLAASMEGGPRAIDLERYGSTSAEDALVPSRAVVSLLEATLGGLAETLVDQPFTEPFAAAPRLIST